MKKRARPPMCDSSEATHGPCPECLEVLEGVDRSVGLAQLGQQICVHRRLNACWIGDAAVEVANWRTFFAYSEGAGGLSHCDAWAIAEDGSGGLWVGRTVVSTTLIPKPVPLSLPNRIQTSQTAFQMSRSMRFFGTVDSPGWE